MTDELMGLGEVAFAAAYLVGERGTLRLQGDARPRRSQPTLAAQALAQGTIVRRDAELALPLVVGDYHVGVLVVELAQDALPPTEHILSTLADLTAVSMRSLSRAESALSEARRDPLTGAGNRRAFYERLETMLAADGRPVAVALIDLDRLKTVNDLGGHEAGDNALRRIARAALASIRAVDDLYRVGGDEFAVVIDGDAAAGERIANRIRAAVAAQRRRGALPTISIGVAAHPEHASEPDELLGKADEALYAAKGAGRDTVVRAGS